MDDGTKLQILARESAEAGFDGFGIASPVLPAVVEERLSVWLRSGYDGDMGYIRRGEAKRRDPRLILPGVKSVICLRTNYFPYSAGDRRSLAYLQDKDRGDVSIYALNVDYHRVIEKKLEHLAAAVRREFPGCATKIYVDTGPVLEKSLAWLAGLGWVGKHTNLVTEGVGSWYFLSEIFTDAELPPATPAIDRCGTCTRCLDICPTRAIVAPYVLDSRRCISYLTIELKGPIPREFRRAIGNRVYGCDDCQIVCPWNSFAAPTDAADYLPGKDGILLADWMRMSDEEFRRRFRNSPIFRIKRRGLLRNVAVALGNSGNPSAIPVLLEALSDPEPLIRAHVIWALGELLGSTACGVIGERLPDERDPLVREEISMLAGRAPTTH